MNARYYGRQVCKDDFGNISQILAPTVLITMKESEVDKFERMMQWIADNEWDFAYSMIVEIDNTVSAYVEVDDGQEGAEFLSYYKAAKKAVN